MQAKIQFELHPHLDYKYQAMGKMWNCGMRNAKSKMWNQKMRNDADWSW